MQTFLKTLKNYGYDDQYRAQVMNTLFKMYTEHTHSRKIVRTKETALFAAFRFVIDRNGYFVFTPEGLHIAEDLVKERVRSVSREIVKPDTFFIIEFVIPFLEEPEIQFLLNSTSLKDVYERTMDILRQAGLSYSENGFQTPKNLHTFFEFPFAEEPFENALREIRAYIRLSPLNKRIMKVTFSDMRDCREEVLRAVDDMRTERLIKEFMRDRGYSFRVTDARKYEEYMGQLLNSALQKLRFAPPTSPYIPEAECGWDSVGLLDEYPVPEEASMNILLFGDPGPLKQLWAQHYTYGELVSGKGCIYVAATSPPEDIEKNFTRFHKNINPFEEQDQLIFIDCYPRRQKSQKHISVPIDTSSLTDFGMAVSEAFQKTPSDEGVVVFDSLSTLMLYFDPEQVIKFAVNQASKLKEQGWTGIFIVEKGVNDEKIENSLKFLLDGVFEISESEFRIQWIRGMVDKPVMYALNISERGLLLLPKR